VRTPARIYAELSELRIPEYKITDGEGQTERHMTYCREMLVYLTTKRDLWVELRKAALKDQSVEIWAYAATQEAAKAATTEVVLFTARNKELI
jgi:hypothetical protein